MNGTDLIQNGEVYLEGEVLMDEWVQWGDTGFSARMVREALAQFDGPVTVVVNSYGGHATEGEAIRAALEAHAGPVTARIAGAAMSAASLLVMSADRIEMTAGSVLMIHDPSGLTLGTAADHERALAGLNALADTYAAVYAARAGMSEAAAREIMRAETFYSPAAALDAGFIDAITGEASDAAPDMQEARAAFASWRQRMSARRPRSGSEPGISTGTAGHQQARAAATLEVSMDPEELENPAATPAPAASAAPVMTGAPASPAPADPAPVTMSADQILANERARVRQIREMAAPFMRSGQISQAQVDALVDEGSTPETASSRLLATLAQSETPVATAAGVTARITRDETDTRAEGMIAAMMRDYSGPGEQFRGMRLRGLAMELAGGRGHDVNAQVARGMRATTMMGGAHGVSDFAYITTEVMNRSLIAEYDRRGANWNVVTGAPMSASDFRELHAVRFGGDFQLKTVKENGEYLEAVLSDEAEGLAVERRGRTIKLTFEAVINDDMGAFNRIPREFALAARVMESSMVWKIIRTNAALKSDGVALFASAHGNLAGSGGAISVASIGAGRAAMWAQKAFGSKDEEDFLQIVPDLLIVPPALETVAMQFVAGITPAKAADVNPYTNSLTPITVPNLAGGVAGGSDTAWYLVSRDLPPVAVAYLEGYESPTVQTIEGMNPDCVTMNARHVFGAAPSEFRGAYKNAGA